MTSTDRLVSLLTGDHRQVTGGHLYNRRMAHQAAYHDMVIEMIDVNRDFDPTSLRGQLLVDSLVAAETSSAIPPGFDEPLTALVHQVPGGVVGTERERRARRSSDRDLYDKCRLVIAASTYLADEVAAVGVPVEKIRVVPPGSDVSTTPIRSIPDLRKGSRLALVNVANWLPNKGILELLDAIDALPLGVATLHLVGSDSLDPEYAEEVRYRIGRLAEGTKVLEHGLVPTDEVFRLYKGADLLVLTSRDEGYGTVVAEALAAEVPVVAWGSGNITNLFEHGREGFQIAPDDVEGLAEVISMLAEDDMLLASISSNAARLGKSLPTWRQSGASFFAALAEARQAAPARPLSVAGSRDSGSAALANGPADRVGLPSTKEAR